MAAADAFVAVTPEYNYGMPAVLKNALDFLYHEWAWKPVAFISYGNTSAGTRSVQMTKQVVTTLRMVPIGATIALRIADALMDERLNSDPDLEQAATHVFDDLTRQLPPFGSFDFPTPRAPRLRRPTPGPPHNAASDPPAKRPGSYRGDCFRRFR